MTKVTFALGWQLAVWMVGGWSRWKGTMGDESRKVVLKITCSASAGIARVTQQVSNVCWLSRCPLQHGISYTALCYFLCHISTQNFVECGQRIRKQGFENLGLWFNFLAFFWPLCFCSNRETLLEVSGKFGFLAWLKFRPLDILFLIDRHGWVFVNEKKSIRLWYEDFAFHFFFLFILGTFFFFSSWSRVKVTLYQRKMMSTAEICFHWYFLISSLHTKCF